MKIEDATAWTGSVTAIAASYLLATNSPYSKYAYILYVISGVAWFWNGLIVRSFPMLVMQAALMGSSLLGLYRWLIR